MVEVRWASRQTRDLFLAHAQPSATSLILSLEVCEVEVNGERGDERMMNRLLFWFFNKSPGDSPLVSHFAPMQRTLI